MKPLLIASNLQKCYGGLVAVDQFSIDLYKGEIHALIGPNGAGKSTAISLLTGEQNPDHGIIELDSVDVTQLRTWQRAQAGIGRSYQITSTINELSVLENLLIALLANTNQKNIGLSNPFQSPELVDQANTSLKEFNLIESSQKLAGELSHGEQGRLEIAMCLATNPKVLLLDEPMSGMSLLDGKKMISALNKIKSSTAILLVEHDMEAVFQLADIISVMASGKIIAVDKPQAIRKNPTVIEAYLGNSDA